MTESQNPSEEYLRHCSTIISKVSAQQKEIKQAAQWFAASILAGRMVHVFGSGHSRIMVEEMWPRYGSFPGFNPIVELSLSFHNLVVGANGQRQAMFLENVSGLAERILRNFDLSEKDTALIISSSGTNIVPVEMAELFQQRKIKVVALITKDHSTKSASKRKDGKKLSDFADLILDSGAPVGDSMVYIKGLETPVAPGSTVGGVMLINSIKAEVAKILTDSGHAPKVLAAANVVGTEKAVELFEAAYDEHAHRMAKLYGHVGIPSYVSENKK
ncbi:MAG TPA: SIS domain-containing protein [Cytophagales bacterium]|nr:SIS domain-containing protein [Cytophagales bacterium]